MSWQSLERSRALWNRDHLDLASDEQLAQLLDLGELEAWRELYRLAAGDPRLRARILDACRRGAVGFPHFWLSAMASLGEALEPWPTPRRRHEDLA